MISIAVYCSFHLLLYYRKTEADQLNWIYKICLVRKSYDARFGFPATPNTSHNEQRQFRSNELVQRTVLSFPYWKPQNDSKISNCAL